VAGYVSGWFTGPQMVTHPATNRSQCRATTLIETNALLDKPRHHCLLCCRGQLAFMSESLMVGLEHAPPNFDVKSRLTGPGVSTPLNTLCSVLSLVLCFFHFELNRIVVSHYWKFLMKLNSFCHTQTSPLISSC